MEIVISANEYADYWRYNVGVNVIPANSKKKIPLVKWSEFQDKPISKELHDQWKEQNKFESGMAVICGKVHFNKEHEGKWLNGIDCDNKLGLDVMCPSGINNIASITVVEQHANKDKGHIYFYTSEPIKSKSGNDGKEGKAPQIEVKSGGKFLLYCAGSYHKDGSLIEILGKREVKTVDKEALETNIDGVCKSYDIPYLSNTSLAKSDMPISELTKDDFIMHEGENRSQALLSYLDSKKIRNPEFDENTLFALGMQYNQKHFEPQYPEEKVRGIARQACGYGTQKLTDNPALLQYVAENKYNFTGPDKIDKVSEVLLKFYNFVTVINTGELLYYNGKVYDNLNAERIVRRETEKLIPNCTEHDRTETINKIKARTYVDISEFDKDTRLITLENGILNIQTLELKPHTPEHLSKVMLPVEYHKPQSEDIEENLKDTLFWNYLKRSFTVEGKFRKEDFETVLEIMASPLIKRHIDERAFMFLGGGENGKSVCLEYMETMLGKHNTSHVPLQSLSDDKFMAAELDGKSANIFSDLEQNELRHSGKIKDITSGEGIQVQRKHKSPFTLYPFSKLVFSCNRFPKSFDQSHGWFRRWVIVKWERNFENDPERNPLLKEQLKENKTEVNMVFSNLVNIANQLNQNGVFTHSKDGKTIQKEWNENADPLDDFATNYIIESEENKSKRETYQFYKEYCFEKGETPLGMGQFSKQFAEYYEEDRDNKTRVWLNIDFKRPIQETLNNEDNT